MATRMQRTTRNGTSHSTVVQRNSLFPAKVESADSYEESWLGRLDLENVAAAMTHSSVRFLVILDVDLDVCILEQSSHDGRLPFMSCPLQSGAPLIVDAIAVRPTVLQDGVDHLQVPVAGETVRIPSIPSGRFAR
ncbi:hypothetical protein CNMCM8980_004882 [Aspergillus fumigatiaffinis]|nr:hypothetical protein CNMCM8980_004882 [Aspergillus fumigatiaffinis]